MIARHSTGARQPLSNGCRLGRAGVNATAGRARLEDCATSPASSNSTSAMVTASAARPQRCMSASIPAGSCPSAASTRAALPSSARAGAPGAAPGSPGHLPFVEHVLRRLDQLGAILDEAVAAFGEWRVDRTGNRKHVAPLLRGEARGDQRAAGERRLDDQHAARETADQPVAARKVARKRRRAQREFRNDAALSGEPVREVAVARRIDAVDAGADDRDATTCAPRALRDAPRRRCPAPVR